MLLGVGASAGFRTPSHPEGSWREDVLLMRDLGVRSCLLDLSWARLEPEEGVFDREALSDLREELMLLRGLDIRPLPALCRGVPPAWFLEKGGWENTENLRPWLLYVERIVRELGHLVPEYITLCEPNSYAARAYFTGDLPPGRHGRTRSTAARVMSVMAGAHIRAYKLIHDLRRGLGFHDTKVGFSLHMVLFRPCRWTNLVRSGEIRMAEDFYHRGPLTAMSAGHFQAPMKTPHRIRPGSYCDFLGIHYGGMVSLGNSARAAHSRRDELGREIRPAGIVDCCRIASAIAGDELPIYITGISAADRQDAFRARFIAEHLEALAMSDLPVTRFHYRNLFDGEGEDAACGLCETEAPDGVSSPRRSGSLYAQIIADKGLTEESYQEYVAGQEYPR